jgi:4'-phosphopantetheinyl transferase
MLPLDQDEIHLWLAYYDKIDNEQIYDAYRALLDEKERQQEPRFYFIRDRRRYLVTRALVRTVLSNYEPVAPKDWIFSTNEYGRPAIANTLSSDPQLSFNISHTHTLIVLGVTRGRALGVDVENVRAREISIEIADRYFSPAEVASLSALPPSQQQERFFEYWTFKESYIKARGMGLAIPLDKFSFQFPHDRSVEIAIHPELKDHPERWLFWQLRPTAEYLVAVCAERAGAQSPTVVAREIVPMDAEKILSLAFFRTTGGGG